MVTSNHFDSSRLSVVEISRSRFSESDLLYFRSIVKRLQQYEPLQYVLGETFFYDLELKIDHRALIPRPETEELVHWIVESNRGEQNLLVADICAGSGCIALALKSKLVEAEIWALELSGDALDLIEENCERTQLELEKLKFDALSDDFQKLENPFDIWVSNPPYIPQKDRNSMHKNVLDFEPEMALFVEDDDPMLFYNAISKNARIGLKSGAWLYFEIHEDYGSLVKEVMKSHGFVNIELRKDLQGKERMIRGQLLLSRYE